MVTAAVCGVLLGDFYTLAAALFDTPDVVAVSPETPFHAPAPCRFTFPSSFVLPHALNLSIPIVGRSAGEVGSQVLRNVERRSGRLDGDTLQHA